MATRSGGRGLSPLVTWALVLVLLVLLASGWDGAR